MRKISRAKFLQEVAEEAEVKQQLSALSAASCKMIGLVRMRFGSWFRRRRLGCPRVEFRLKLTRLFLQNVVIRHRDTAQHRTDDAEEALVRSAQI